MSTTVIDPSALSPALLTLSRKDTEKIVIFHAGTKGGIGKSVLMSQLYAWYRACLGIEAKCVDLDETYSFSNLMKGVSGEVLNLRSLEPTDAGETVISRFLEKLPTMNEEVVLVDLPASSSKDFALNLVTNLESRLEDLEDHGIKICFLYTINSSVESANMAVAWSKLVAKIPHVSLVVCNEYAGPCQPVPSELGSLPPAIFGLIGNRVDLLNTPLMPAPWMFLPHVKSLSKDLIHASNTLGFGRAGVKTKIQMEADVRKNWKPEICTKGVFVAGQESNTLEKLFEGFAAWSEEVVPFSADARLAESDRLGGFPEMPPAVLFYARIRELPDVRVENPKWDDVVPVPTLFRHYNPDLKFGPGAAAAEVAEAAVPAKASKLSDSTGL